MVTPHMALRVGGGGAASSSSLFRFRPHRILSSTSGRGSPAEEFAPLAATFRRRLLAGLGAASLVVVGANFGGVTSLLLGLSPDLGRGLRLDVLYPVEGFTRCLDPNNGFEFIYPASWVGDRTVLYRAVGEAEAERGLDPPPLGSGRRPPRSFSEPLVAFGPPGTKGELNVSVIVSSVSPGFSIESFGGPKEVGEAVLKKIAGSRPDITATLVDTSLRQDSLHNLNYYKLEFRVQSPSFHRHNVAICTVRGSKLFTLNAQAPESVWHKVKEDFYKIADSFNLTET